MKPLLRSAVLLTIMVISTACRAEDDTATQPEMDGMAEIEAPQIPAVVGYYAGEEIAFIHPEASDSDIAGMLTEMMDSPVLTVPSLAGVNEEALSDVYVFTNGVRPRHRGPLGFQPDVFATAPGDSAYTPLRRIVLVTWSNQARSRELKSAAEITTAETEGEIMLERTQSVVNMPFLRWPGGQR